MMHDGKGQPQPQPMQGVERQQATAPARPHRAPPPTIYRTPAGQQEIQRLYDRALSALPYPHEEHVVPTSWGNAHVVVCGPADAPPLVLWHGAGAPAPFMLRFFDPLLLDSSPPPFRIYCPDLPLHAGSRSEDAEFDLAQHEQGRWCLEVLQGMGLVEGPQAALPSGGSTSGSAAAGSGSPPPLAPSPSSSLHPAPFHVGVSFGAAVLLDLAVVAPKAIRAAALVVPGGLAPMRTWALTFQLFLPSMLYRWLPCRWTERLAVAGLSDSCEEQIKELDEVIKLGFRHVCHYPQIPGGRSGFTPDQLCGFTAPAIVIAAENDFYSPGHAVAAAAKLSLPGCRRTIIMPGARHLQSRDSVAEVNRLVAEFFTENAAAGLALTNEA